MSEWIPIKSRPMDEDEREEWSAKLGHKLEDDEAVIYTSQLPDDGQEVLICLRNGDIRMDAFGEDDLGCYFDECDIEDAIAWTPLPEPWKGEE